MSDSALARQAEDPLALIGGTPLLALSRLPGPGAARVLAKCEQYNPGGSVKDRIALAMIEAAEGAGRIQPGRSVIVEPTSGNTGISLALVCAVRGYRLVLTMPASMSLERRELLRAYGAELILTPAADDMAGAVAAARQLCDGRPDHFMPQQFDNPENPRAHRRTTGREILAQTAGLRLDALVVGVGTGGTLTGVGGLLKEHHPPLRIHAVEPEGSQVLAGKPPGPHLLQGLGAGFVPSVLDRSLIDEIIPVSDGDAHATKDRLAREEGLLVGISAGAAVFAACRVARQLGPDATVVTVLCDTGERYFSLDELFA